jgi:hypothetical protein
MAEGVTPETSGGELEPVAGRELDTTHSKELERYTPRVTHGHETRFRFSYAILAGVGIAAVAAAAIFLIAGKPPTPPAWSTWEPTASGDQALGQIANHVAPNYRFPTGEQLVAVDGGPLELAGGIPVKIVLRTRTASSLSDGKGALYSLCGLGKNCSITLGKPSHERTLLMQREAYELALYTFHYVGDVKQVVVLLPPPPGKTASHAMYFKKAELAPQLARPLRFTLSGKAPSIASLRGGPTRDFIKKTTGRDAYNFDVVQAQDASVLLELAHFKLQGTAAGSGGSGSSGAGSSGGGTP